MILITASAFFKNTPVRFLLFNFHHSMVSEYLTDGNQVISIRTVLVQLVAIFLVMVSGSFYQKWMLSI